MPCSGSDNVHAKHAHGSVRSPLTLTCDIFEVAFFLLVQPYRVLYNLAHFHLRSHTNAQEKSNVLLPNLPQHCSHLTAHRGTRASRRGAALYAQLEAIWTALGLQDLRMLVLVALLVTAALLRLYAHLGWFD